MKIAKLPDGQLTEASKHAPRQGVCPHCDAPVYLRQRKLMNKRDVVYFWRHRDNQSQACPARRNPSAY